MYVPRLLAIIQNHSYTYMLGIAVKLHYVGIVRLNTVEFIDVSVLVDVIVKVPVHGRVS